PRQSLRSPFRIRVPHYLAAYWSWVRREARCPDLVISPSNHRHVAGLLGITAGLSSSTPTRSSSTFGLCPADHRPTMCGRRADVPPEGNERRNIIRGGHRGLGILLVPRPGDLAGERLERLANGDAAEGVDLTQVSGVLQRKQGVEGGVWTCLISDLKQRVPSGRSGPGRDPA